MNAEPTPEVGLEEAARAEQEAFERERLEADSAFDSDPAPEGEPAPEPEPEPAPEPPSDKVAEDASRALEKMADAYVKRARNSGTLEVLGLTECPVCPVPGFVPDVPGLGMPAEHKTFLLELLGAEPAPVQAPHPHLERCELCDGLGFLDTGSRRQGYTELDCEVCGGKGYVDKRHAKALEDARPPNYLTGELPPPLYPVPAPAPVAAGTVTQGGHVFFPTPGGSSDPYGRIAGHPLWGQPHEAGGF